MRPDGLQEDSILYRARSLRVETAALLSAARTVLGKDPGPVEVYNIPEDWHPQFHRHREEKLARLTSSIAGTRKSC